MTKSELNKYRNVLETRAADWRRDSCKMDSSRNGDGAILRQCAADGADPSDFPYGERQYNVQDLAGHFWTFTQSIADVDPKEWGGTPGNL